MPKRLLTEGAAYAHYFADCPCFAATPRRHPGCKVEWGGSVELNLCTRDARALAAALLAAADVAEVATS